MESQITQSTECGELYKALAKFHTLPISIDKKGTNPMFKSKYAKLEDVLAAIKEPLKKAGLIFTQVPVGQCGLVTRVIHPESGQWLEGYYQMKPDKETPQGYGSVLTYQKRYALVSTFGLNVDDDDDANGAMATTTQPVNKSVDTVDSDEKCDVCGGPMWDNRTNKKSPSSPDFVCKQENGECKSDKGFPTAKWVKDMKKAPAPDNKVTPQMKKNMEEFEKDLK